MIEWCRTGPPHAHVTKVQTEWEECRGEQSGFSIRG